MLMTSLLRPPFAKHPVGTTTAGTLYYWRRGRRKANLYYINRLYERHKMREYLTSKTKELRHCEERSLRRSNPTPHHLRLLRPSGLAMTGMIQALGTPS